MTSLDPNSDTFIVFSDFKDTNDQWNFVDFILYLINGKHLVFNDFFIMDNAKIHCVNNTFLAISRLLEDLGIQIIFLPAYSPEFNSYELIFRKMNVICIFFTL